MSRHEELQLRILDVLIEDGREVFTARWGQVITTLATLAFDRPIGSQTPEYHATSLAILALEAAGLIRVHRAYEARHHRANVLVGLELL